MILNCFIFTILYISSRNPVNDCRSRLLLCIWTDFKDQTFWICRLDTTRYHFFNVFNLRTKPFLIFLLVWLSEFMIKWFKQFLNNQCRNSFWMTKTISKRVARMRVRPNSSFSLPLIAYLFMRLSEMRFNLSIEFYSFSTHGTLLIFLFICYIEGISSLFNIHPEQHILRLPSSPV